MAITKVSPDAADLITAFADSATFSLKHSNLQAGDVVFVIIHRRRNTNGTTNANPLTITSGNANRQSLNTAYRQMISTSSVWYHEYRNENNNSDCTAGAYRFVVGADDLSNGALSISIDMTTGLRTGIGMVAFRGVDTGTYWSTTTSDANEILTNNFDTTNDDCIEFTSPNVTALQNFWNNGTGNLDVPHTVVAMGAFGRVGFTANEITQTGWTEGFSLAGGDTFTESGSNNTLLCMYRSFSTYTSSNMDNLSVCQPSGERNQRSWSFWQVLREAATANDETRAFNDTVSASDTLSPVEDAEAFTFNEEDTASASDSRSFVEDTQSTAFSEEDTSEVSDSVAFVSAHVFTATDTAESEDTSTFTEDVQAFTFDEEDTASAEDSRTFTEDAQAFTFNEEDTVSANDDRTFAETSGETRAFEDTVGVQDTLTPVEDSQAFTFNEEDTLSVQDTLTPVEDTGSTAFSEEDTSEASDSGTFVSAHVVTATDTVGVEDTRTFVEDAKAFAFDESDTVSVEDSRTFTEDAQAFAFNEEDTASADDDRTFTKTPFGGQETRSFTDTSLSNDVQVLGLVRSFSDTLSVQTSLVTEEDVVNYTESFPDSSAAQDSLSLVFVQSRAFVDFSDTNDSFDPTSHFAFNQTETANTNDSLAVVSGGLADFTDTVSVEDTSLFAYVYESQSSVADTIATDHSKALAIGDIVGVGLIEGQSPPELLTIGEALALIDIYNTALNALGVGTITAVTDSSPQATILNDVWPGFRKQFLTDHSWNGAKKTVALSRLQDYQNTDVVPAGDRWKYAYVLPADYLRVLRINGYERYNATQRHLQNAFEIMVVNYSDSSTTTKDVRCLLTTEGTVNLEYIFDPGNDDIDLLGAQTSHAVGLSLAHYVARNFGKTPQEIAVLAQEARVAVSAAKGSDGQENSSRLRPDMNILESRHWWVG